MAKKAKQKLNFKPTPISRLSRMTVPFKMVGDPDWGCGGKNSWHRREKAVYADMMIIKRGGWTDTLWLAANVHNERIDRLLARKWHDYEIMLEDIRLAEIEEAERDNAAWDYHHEYTPNLEVA